MTEADEEYSPPEPPDGLDNDPDEYDELNGFHDAISSSKGRRILMLELALALAALAVLPFGISTVQEAVWAVGGAPLGALAVLVGGAISIYVVTVVLHEQVHRVVNEYYGYVVEIRYGFPISYALVTEQWIAREHNLVALVAPLLVISPTSYVLCITVSSPVLTVIFGYVFFINTAASCSDLYSFRSLGSRPEGSMGWIAETNDGIRSFIYEPSS